MKRAEKIEKMSSAGPRQPLRVVPPRETPAAAASRVIAHAVRTFGSDDKARRWLQTECGALDHAIPEALLESGKWEAVDAELDRIDYGVYV